MARVLTVQSILATTRICLDPFVNTQRKPEYFIQRAYCTHANFTLRLSYCISRFPSDASLWLIFMEQVKMLLCFSSTRLCVAGISYAKPIISYYAIY